MLFRVYCFAATGDGGLSVCHNRHFRTEREARAYINERADGGATFRLYEIKDMQRPSDDVLIVTSRWPVLMVA
jgi:hypothetical protein